MLKRVYLWLDKNKNFSILASILIAFYIFLASSLTFAEGGPGASLSFLSIAYHICVFFALSFFTLFIFKKDEKTVLIFLIFFFMVVSYAALDEIHQFFVPGRFPSTYDFLLDFIGILFASSIHLVNLIFLKK